jgi:hypothetical protein
VLGVTSANGACGFVALCQPLAGVRMLVVAQGQKGILRDLSIQIQRLGTAPDPLSGNVRRFRVVVAYRQVLLKIALRIAKIVLGLRSEHAPIGTETGDEDRSAAGAVSSAGSAKTCA